MNNVRQAVEAFLENYKDKRIAVAVSGGSDSLALLYAVYEAVGNENLVVFHFNHNLRPEAEAEAHLVAEITARMGIPCAVRVWHHESHKKDGHNLMQKARIARYSAFKELCEEYNVDAVCVGHTADDVAESFMMRLGRGSGIAGLASMRSSGDVLGVSVIRPILSCTRQGLKDYLTSRGQDWVNDPSNEKTDFLRVRVRRAKEAFEKIGLPFESIFASSVSLRRAEDALNAWAEQLWCNVMTVVNEKTIEINNEFWQQQQEMQLRLLAKIMLHFTGDTLAPRTSKRLNLLDVMSKTEVGKWTLGGVIFEKKKEVITCRAEKQAAVKRVEKLLKKSL